MATLQSESPEGRVAHAARRIEASETGERKVDWCSAHLGFAGLRAGVRDVMSVGLGTSEKQLLGIRHGTQD